MKRSIPGALQFIGENIADLADVVLSAKAQRKCLKPARIREKRSRKAHEPVQAAKLSNQLIPRLEVKMVGIGQGTLHAQLSQIVRPKRPHAGHRRHRHQVRRPDISAPGSDQAEPGIGLFVFL